jgi:hypothetical protein
VGKLVEVSLQAGRSRVPFPMRSLEYFIDVIFPAAHDPGVDSVSNRNEYPRYVQGGKSVWYVGVTTLPHSCDCCLENLGASTSGSPDL